MNQIIIGFTTEGVTDVRLLSSIVLRTFEEVAKECKNQIEVINPIIHIPKTPGYDFIETIYQSSKTAFAKGLMAFCVHADADDENSRTVMNNKIVPCFDFILAKDEHELCKNLIPIVPIQMSEAWMLADKQLLKDEIGTNKTDIQLGIHRSPESYANPKMAIENAIRIARQDYAKKRRYDLNISELYQPIGQKISLIKLEQLESYTVFKESVRNAYRYLSYLH